ncbi:MAG: mechanosensitive ion channel family protein [Cyanobacteria bacterium HKST-UBA04]|nr:mechanosensitive ion channel family protein [Cyanobacteria bacterium HKST-UBA04]
MILYPRDFSLFINQTFGISVPIQLKLLTSFVIVFGLWITLLFVRRFVLRHTEDATVAYRWNKSLSHVFFILGALLVARTWFSGIESVATFLGLFSAGMAVALQQPITDLAGWAFIAWRKPFEVGDRVEIGAHRGDVIDQRFFMFTLMEVGNWVDADQSTGRIIHVPNGSVFSLPLANYTQGFQYIWDELGVLVTFESDWQKAQGLLEAMAKEHTLHLSTQAERSVKQAARKMLIFYNNLSPRVYVSVKDSGVMLTIRYLTEPRKRRGDKELLWKDILLAFAQHDDIDFAYPSQRVFLNHLEGKPGTRPEAVNVLP